MSTLGGAVVVEEVFDAMERRKNDFAFLDEVEQGQGQGRVGGDNANGAGDGGSVNKRSNVFGSSSGSSSDRQNNASAPAFGSSSSSSKNNSRSSSSTSLGSSAFLTLQNTSAAYQVTPSHQTSSNIPQSSSCSYPLALTVSSSSSPMSVSGPFYLTYMLI